ncbi:hypothetical protein M758_4G158600 [Ceratodon purpureus]|uniref:Uncharacterized protein n=1 Tax=Ceratodon purpureus TaxID=3225 RepID=A0A8T0I982_CERPU|nr:hypothetical protein KC19_4G158100 [Ceratodon purpureus]KAG0619705.1 hypothetical protein M758_4G158600 [Ceratodon purpureus]
MPVPRRRRPGGVVSRRKRRHSLSQGERLAPGSDEDHLRRGVTLQTQERRLRSWGWCSVGPSFAGEGSGGEGHRHCRARIRPYDSHSDGASIFHLVLFASGHLHVCLLLSFWGFRFAGGLRQRQFSSEVERTALSH